jgi:glucose/arabinose dehydrogenase/mono/diheme cytochrome c family protein
LRTTIMKYASLLLVLMIPMVDARRAGGAENRPGASFVETNFPFFSSVVDARKLGSGWPTNNLTPRGLILNLGHGCWACFDTDLLRIAAIWSDPMEVPLTPVSMSQGSYHMSGVKALEGQSKLPTPAGKVWLANGIYPGWQMGPTFLLIDPRTPGSDPREVGRGPIDSEQGQYKGLQFSANGVRLDYEVAHVPVSEWLGAHSDENGTVVQRRFLIAPFREPLWLLLGQRPKSVSGEVHLVASAPICELLERADGLHFASLKPSLTPVEFSITISLNGQKAPWPAGKDQGVRKRWPQSATTRATLSTSTNAYVIDNIELPITNPWHRNVRLADIAFLGGGRAAAITFDGDVWSIEGLDGDLQKIVWRRFASGLHEPLSIVNRGGELFVNDRNGIWRLRDTDGDGEADVHEMFCNAFGQTAETREFATSMKLAPDGSFVIAKGGQQASTIGKHNGTILRVSADGKNVTQLAWGLRMPFLGVHPRSGLITASDQQGHYVPATPLHIIRENQYHGFLPLIQPKEQYPAPIAEPLTWIPHSINPSGVCQVWLDGARMGPLNDAFIHLGYYRPEIFLVRMNERAAEPQAAVVSLTRELDFPLLSGAVNPADGQLYVVGFQIWGTEAKQISGLARLRYTGAPCTSPREVVAMDKGILVKFDSAMDSKPLTDPVRFSAERWNYKRTANYGSPHFKLDGFKGQETLIPSSVYLSRDGRSVFVGIPDMRPAMQMRLGSSLSTTNGTTFGDNVYFTPRALIPFDPVKEGFDPLTVDLTPRRPQETTAAAPVTVEEGQRLAALMGCVACHSIDGSTLGKVGPSWKGVFGSERRFAGGTKTKADETYLRESIREPALRIVAGFDNSDTGMPSYEGVITESQIEALVLYIKSLR